MSFRNLNSHALGVALTLSLAATAASAQSATITGHIRAVDGSIPAQPKVILADVQNEGVFRESVSVNAATGEFEIRNVQEGNYRLVGCAGTTYAPSKLEFHVNGGEVRPADLTLVVPDQRRIVTGGSVRAGETVSALAYRCEVASVTADRRGRYKFDDLPVPPKLYKIGRRSRSGKFFESNAIDVTTRTETKIGLVFLGRAGSETGLSAQVISTRCDLGSSEETDLTGNYSGILRYNDASVADATLRITGNDFVLTSADLTKSGTIMAVKTCGYTGATIRFADSVSSTKPGPLALSVTVHKTADRLNLQPARGETRTFSFTPTAQPKFRHQR